MENATDLKPTVVVIFGGGGDLTRRKIVPALFNICGSFNCSRWTKLAIADDSG